MRNISRDSSGSPFLGIPATDIEINSLLPCNNENVSFHDEIVGSYLCLESSLLVCEITRLLCINYFLLSCYEYFIGLIFRY
jgi:hypothetical protein